MSGCSAEGCYAVVRGDRLLRVSFSKSVCDHIAARVPGTESVAARVRTGPALAAGEPSPTGLYVVAKAKSLWPLRVTLFPELADHWRDPSRVVTVGYLDVRQKSGVGPC